MGLMESDTQECRSKSVNCLCVFCQKMCASTWLCVSDIHVEYEIVKLHGLCTYLLYFFSPCYDLNSTFVWVRDIAGSPEPCQSLLIWCKRILILMDFIWSTIGHNNLLYCKFFAYNSYRQLHNPHQLDICDLHGHLRHGKHSRSVD